MVRILRLAKISRMSEAVQVSRQILACHMCVRLYDQINSAESEADSNLQEQIQSQTANIHYSLFKSGSIAINSCLSGERDNNTFQVRLSIPRNLGTKSLALVATSTGYLATIYLPTVPLPPSGLPQPHQKKKRCGSGIFRLLLLTHLLACSWYGIGRLSGEEWGTFAEIQHTCHI